MPFMNLMVILLPFLLVTAVFSRTAVLELNLPGPSSAREPAGQTSRSRSPCATTASRSATARRAC